MILHGTRALRNNTQDTKRQKYEYTRNAGSAPDSARISHVSLHKKTSRKFRPFCCRKPIADGTYRGAFRGEANIDGLRSGLYDGCHFAGGQHMAKKTKLTKVAVSIGTAAGTADRVAHRTARQVASASAAVKDELADIAKQVEGLKKQLLKTSKRLQKALK
jgi:hypothetical protein